MLSVMNSRKAMQNRIEYLRAKYSKPIEDHVFDSIADDLVSGRKNLLIDGRKFKGKEKSPREVIRYSVDQLRAYLLMKEKFDSKEISSLRKSIMRNYKNRWLYKLSK